MNKYSNIKKMVDLSLNSWRSARDAGLTGIRTTKVEGNKFVAEDGHQFINMVSCSYLGLNQHPKVLEGAIAAIKNEQLLSTSVSRARIAPKLLDDTENLLSRVFNAYCVLTLSCSTASAGVLPLLASGHLTDGKKPLLIFDRNSHFSINVMKAACSDETEILTCENNDIEFIEKKCLEHKQVAFISDGAFSMGGIAPIEKLKELQSKYGLFLYLDDSHSLSVYGAHGEGLVRSQFTEMPKKTIIVGSLAKAFGATGGLIMYGDHSFKELFDFCAGPLGWSQMCSTSSLGAIKASAQLHLSKEIEEFQLKLKANMSLIDEAIQTENAGNNLPIRVFNIGEADRSVQVAKRMYEKGFYCSAVFFPIVKMGNAGLRIMGRANLDEDDLNRFCQSLNDVLNK